MCIRDRPTPNWLKRIGIVSGHRGPQNDPGAVCPDGLTEAEINFNVASAVVRKLRSMGFTSDLLDEFDARLDNYQAAAMVSIHANTCKDFGERVSGYIVAKAAARPEGGLDTLLAECVAEHYGKAVPIERRFSLTRDMTDYHSFREINPLTPAAIIELGFMKDDREILTTKTEQMAQGIVDGLLCFLQPQNPSSGNAILVTPGMDAPTPTPTSGNGS
jgi:N-acetylmuramoyl-L-alanine amidase